MRNPLLLLMLTAVAWSWNSPEVGAGEFNRVLSIGDQAPAWGPLPTVEDKELSLDDLSKAKAIVLVFTCNSCPYAVDAEKRLVEFHRQYADRQVALVAVNVNDNEEDRMPAMKKKAAEAGFRFPYLFDSSQKIAKEYGAKYTPEFFVLDADRKVAYMGAFDDSADGKSVSQRYVPDAVEAVLGGREPTVKETVPIGCRIRMKRVRRRRSAKKPSP